MLAIADDKAEIRCLACQGELGAGNVGLPCPHCGELIKHLVDGQIIDRDELVVCEDAYCHACGYNLRTLSVWSQCPECGDLVAESLVGRSLSFSDRDWLMVVHFGTKVLAAGLIGLWVSVLAVNVIGGLMTWLGLPCLFVSLLLLITGSICVSNIDLRSLPRKGTPWSNRLAMILPFALLIASCASVFEPGRVSRGSLPILVIAVELAVVVNVVAVGLCLKRMAVRHGRLRLAKNTIVAFVVTAVAISFSFAVALREMIVWSVGSDPLQEALYAISTFLLGLSCLATLWAIFRVKSMLGEVRRAADQL